MEGYARVFLLEALRQSVGLVCVLCQVLLQMVGGTVLVLGFVLWLAWGDEDLLTGLFGPPACRQVQIQMLEAAQRTTPCMQVTVPPILPE